MQPNLDQQVALVSRTLISRPNIERLIRMTDMDLKVKTPADRERNDRRPYAHAEDRRRRLATTCTRLAIAIPSPDQAKRVVQSLLSIFVESSLGNTRKDTDIARRFIEEQIRHYEKRLEEAEARLKDFRLKNMSLVGADGRDYFARMATLGEALNAAQARPPRRRAVARRAQARARRRGAGVSSGDTGRHRPVRRASELDARIDVAEEVAR